MLKKARKTDKTEALEEEAERRQKVVKEKLSRKKGGGGKAATGSQFVLIIGDEGAILVFMQGVKVVRRLFAPSSQPSHTEAMRDIMRSNPNVPICMLMDVLDQQYIPHNFPPVSALSVGGLVKRRLARDFQPEDLKGALPLGREKTGRKEWKFLLVSLARTPVVSEWIDLLVELPNELKGIYLVPVETVKYVARLKKKQSSEQPCPWQLFISHNKVSGFRQVVLHDGKLVFTRVSQVIDDGIAAVIAGSVEQEIINTMEYLKRLEFRETTELEATIVISSDVGESVDLKRFNFGDAQILSPLDVAESLGLEQAALSADRFGDVVMAAAFGIEKKHVLRFSNAYIDKLAGLYKARIALRVASILLSILFVGMSVLALVGVASDWSSIAKAREDTQKISGELSTVRAKLDALNKGTGVLSKSAVVAAYDAYMKNVVAPQDTAKDLRPFITKTQRLNTMDWEYTFSDAKPGSGSPAPNKVPLKAKVEFDLGAGGRTIESLTKNANSLVEGMKAKLDKYEVSAEPYPWVKEASAQGAISLDIKPESAEIQNANVLLTLTGPKSSTQAGTPDSPPLGGM